jgi:hypothetical protein
MRGTLQERFDAKVDVNGPIPAHRPELGPCHVWTGYVREDGYGEIKLDDGTTELTHRVAWLIAEGRMPYPCGLHHCDNRACVRRAHLFEGTKRDNARDMAAKGRQALQAHPERAARGSRNGMNVHPWRRPIGDRNGARTKPETRPRGENHGRATITDAACEDIRIRRSRGETLASIAAAHGVHVSTASRIARGESRGGVASR